MKLSENIRKQITATKQNYNVVATECLRVKGIIDATQLEITALNETHAKMTAEINGLISKRDELQPLILVERATEAQLNEVDALIDKMHLERDAVTIETRQLSQKKSAIDDHLKSENAKAAKLYRDFSLTLKNDYLKALATEKIPEYEKLVDELTEIIAYITAVDKITHGDIFKLAARFIVPAPKDLKRSEYFFDTKPNFGTYPAQDTLKEKVRAYEFALNIEY